MDTIQPLTSSSQTTQETCEGTTSNNNSKKKKMKSRSKQRVLTEHQILDKLKNSIFEAVVVDQTPVNFIKSLNEAKDVIKKVGLN